MKKIFCSFVILILSSSIFALGAGFQISGKPAIMMPFENPSCEFAISENVSGTFKMERIPLVISGGVDLLQAENIFNFGLSISGDYIFFENQIKNYVNCYGGTGLTGSILFNKDFATMLKGGLRFLLGVNWHFYTGYLELYVQEIVSPNVMYNVPANSSVFILEFPAELGLRFHF